MLSPKEERDKTVVLSTALGTSWAVLVLTSGVALLLRETKMFWWLVAHALFALVSVVLTARFLYRHLHRPIDEERVPTERDA